MVAKPKTFAFTVDCEFDWGGRTYGTQGLEEGLPFILELFRAYKVQGLFFISTELLKNHARYARSIKSHGHTIGAHGHFHEVFKSKERNLANLELSRDMIKVYGLGEDVPVRAPKFCHEVKTSVYSTPKNHVGLLRMVWGIDRYKPSNIIYLHPFDLVKPVTKAPNLFCKLWYSRSKSAKVLLTKLVKDNHETMLH